MTQMARTYGLDRYDPAPSRPEPPCRAAPHPNREARMVLRLGGSFAIGRPDGSTLALSQKKGRLLLAMLACAPGMGRSRDWLRRHLWSRSFTAHGFSSLRQCLHNLKRSLGPQADCLQTSREYVWLVDTEVDWGGAEGNPALFLEDAIKLDGPAQEWIERERTRFAPAPKAGPAPESDAAMDRI